MEGNRDWRRLVWGLVFIGVGFFLLLERMDALPAWANHSEWWPTLVIALGVVVLLTARGAENVGTGVFVSLMGVWVLLVMNRMYGLSWYNSWPLVLVAAGASSVARAIAATWLPDRRRERWEARRRRRHGNVEVVIDHDDPAHTGGDHV